MELAPNTTIEVVPPAPQVVPVYQTRGEKGDAGAPGGSDAAFAAFVDDPASATRASLTATYVAKVAAPTGVAATDGPAIQAALDAASTAGGGIVLLQRGAYVTGVRLDIPSKVTLCGAGREATVVRASPTLTNPAVRLRGTTDVTLSDLTVEHNNTGSLIGIITECPSTTDFAVRHRITRVRITLATNNAVRIVNAVKDYAFEDNLIDGCISGLSFLSPSASASTGIRLERNTIRNITGGGGPVGLQVFGTSGFIYSDVVVRGNILTDLSATTIPIEIGRTRRAVISDNVITAATRGISTSNNDGLTITGNIIQNQSLYAVECGNNIRTVVSDNVAISCRTFLFDTVGGSTDLVISGNSIIGSGMTTAQSNTYVIQLAVAATNVVIVGNTVRSHDYLSGFVRLGTGAQAVVNARIADNLIVADTANAPVQAINLAAVTDAVVESNTIKISRDLTAADNDARVIIAVMGANTIGALIHGNQVMFTGNVAAANSIGIGTNLSAAAALARSVCRNNRVYGAPVGYRWDATSGDSVFENNTAPGCATEVSNINAAVVYRRTKRSAEGSAAPTAGTWAVGDIVWNSAPTAGGTPGWMCTATGTPGTWKALPNLAA